jgi:AraC-like DNA-binding protein
LRSSQVREFIDENLDHDLGLAELSAVAGLSQFHFARAFRKSTGLTPQQSAEPDAPIGKPLGYASDQAMRK